jgi:hypothetical protein
MKLLNVVFNGWGERWPIGVLADDGRDILFEYAPEALRRGIEFSPRHLPLRAGGFSGFPSHQQRLPGLLAQGKDSAILKQMVLLGGSPHGSRPKVLVQYDPANGQLSTLDDTHWGQPWLIKFQAQNEHKEVCAIEYVYAELARRCGLEMPQTRHVDLDRHLAAFGARRFDREDGGRVPVHTLAGLLHVGFRLPSADYSTFLRASRPARGRSGLPALRLQCAV